MKLIVGLGNPGKQYENTRHNMGYLVLDAFSEMLGCDMDRHDFKGTYGILKQSIANEPLIMLKPETFMNLSGESVRAISDYFKIPVDDIVIVFDDMAIPPGKIRLRPGGSSGSHNGMKNIIQHMGTENIKRIRIGIGEPVHSGVDFVLSKPNAEEQELIDQAVLEACRALKEYLQNGWNQAMNKFN